MRFFIATQAIRFFTGHNASLKRLYHTRFIIHNLMRIVFVIQRFSSFIPLRLRFRKTCLIIEKRVSVIIFDSMTSIGLLEGGALTT